jgi:hypothetical protein
MAQDLSAPTCLQTISQFKNCYKFYSLFSQLLEKSVGLLGVCPESQRPAFFSVKVVRCLARPKGLIYLKLL